MLYTPEFRFRWFPFSNKTSDLAQWLKILARTHDRRRQRGGDRKEETKRSAQ